MSKAIEHLVFAAGKTADETYTAQEILNDIGNPDAQDDPEFLKWLAEHEFITGQQLQALLRNLPLGSLEVAVHHYDMILSSILSTLGASEEPLPEPASAFLDEVRQKAVASLVTFG